MKAFLLTLRRRAVSHFNQVISSDCWCGIEAFVGHRSNTGIASDYTIHAVGQRVASNT